MTDRVEPGSFRPGPEIQLPTPAEANQPGELKTVVYSDLVESYKVFSQEINPQTGIIYHPCNAFDVSPSSAFPNSRVVYADIDETAVRTLRAGGFEAHNVSALEFDPGLVDVLIMINPQIPPAVPASYLKEGGYAIANDYHYTATQLRENQDFELRGIIRRTKDKGLFLDTQNPDDYWKEIETEEEFKNAPFSWGAENYDGAARIVKALTGKQDNILEEYKKLIAMAKEKSRKEREEFFVIPYEGRQLVLQTKLPSKKGVIDDLFVFERVSERLKTPEDSYDEN